MIAEVARGQGTWSWVVPDGLWEAAKPLIPPPRVRPQGGGTPDTPDETVFAAIVYVLVSGCAWRALPPCFGISKSTAHRRFLLWSRSGVWGRLYEATAPYGDGSDVSVLTRVLLDSARARYAGAGPASRDGLGPGRRIPRCALCRHRRTCPSSPAGRPAHAGGPRVPRGG